jgi:hypothetical protein
MLLKIPNNQDGNEKGIKAIPMYRRPIILYKISLHLLIVVFISVLRIMK